MDSRSRGHPERHQERQGPAQVRGPCLKELPGIEGAGPRLPTRIPRRPTDTLPGFSGTRALLITPVWTRGSLDVARPQRWAVSGILAQTRRRSSRSWDWWLESERACETPHGTATDGSRKPWTGRMRRPGDPRCSGNAYLG